MNSVWSRKDFSFRIFLAAVVTHIFFRRYYSPTLSPCFFIALIKMWAVPEAVRLIIPKYIPETCFAKIHSFLLFHISLSSIIFNLNVKLSLGKLNELKS